MQIQNLKISEVRAYEKNPRKNDDAVNGVAESIKEFGFKQPLVVDKNKVLIAGHTRLKAAKQLGLEEVPCLIAEDLTSDQVRAYRILDNKLAEKSAWDLNLLKVELSQIEMDLEPFECDFSELEEDKEISEDEAPEVSEQIVTCNGDLWILGEHRLLCGDSTKEEDVKRLMAGAKADLCFTSPPYNSKDGGYKTDYSGRTKKFYNHQCDNRTEDEWVEFCDSVLRIVATTLKSEDSPVIWNVMYTAHCRSGYGRTMFSGSHGLSVKETICWDKGAGFPTASRGILSRNWELVFVLSRGNKYTTTQGENEPRWAKWDISRPKQTEEHKATFPVELASRAMCDFGAIGDNVYDPFLGSGTTLIAAEQLGRKCYGMEISPQYCDVIVKRWQNLTGKEAMLEANGDTFNEIFKRQYGKTEET